MSDAKGLFPAKDRGLDDQELEKLKVAARRMIKPSKKTLTVEVNSWTKLLHKYKAKERLSVAERSLIKSVSELGQEAILRYQESIDKALKDLISISSQVDGERAMLWLWSSGLMTSYKKW